MRTEITKKDFAEFYILSALSPIIEREETELHNKLVIYRNNLVIDILKFYLEHLQVACVQEAQHENYRYWPTGKKYENNRQRLTTLGISENNKISDTFLYASESGRSNPFRSADRLITLFRDLKWSPSYGGPAWARIAELYKELVVCWSSLRVLDTTDFNPDNGYDVYTHHNIRMIRRHLDRSIYHQVQKTIHVIDMVHQVEHNTGSIFTKFPGNMTSWLDTILNEKAIAASIQILRRYVGFEIRNTLKELNIPEQPEADVERQLGQVILARRAAKELQQKELVYQEDLSYIERDYKSRLFTKEVYRTKLKDLKLNYNESTKNHSSYVYALTDNRKSPRNQRGIMREIIALSEDDSSILDNSGYILSGVKDRVYGDYEMFKLLKNAPAWNDALIETIIPYYFVLPLKWRKEITDFLFAKFNTLKLGAKKVAALYENLAIDGYDLSKLNKPDAGVKNSNCQCYDCAPRPGKAVMNLASKQEKAKAFAIANIGKQIIGTSRWIQNSVNKFMPALYHVDSEMPIGTIIDYKGTKVVFAPSEHWKENGYTDSHYEVALTDIELYDESKPKNKKKPNNFKSFAITYAGHKIVFRKDVNPSFGIKVPIGVVIGYAITKENENQIYYIPSEELIAAGFSGHKVEPGTIKYTVNGYNDSNVPLCLSAPYDEIALFTDPDNKFVEIHSAPLKPMPPLGGGSPAEFAIKYAGKAIKASEKLTYYLNMVNNWDINKPIGNVAGYVQQSMVKICFIPSQDFVNAGWPGIVNFGGFICTAKQYSDAPTYYTINWNDVELADGEYTDQNEGKAIESGLTPNQKFAVDYAGKPILGIYGPWQNVTTISGEKWNTKTPIGNVIGYKGSVIYYTPSQEFIAAGYDGIVVDGITYTDEAAIGKKCYPLLGTSTIVIYDDSNKHKIAYINAGYKAFATKNGGKKVKASGEAWSNLINSSGEKWNMDWPLGTIIGFNKSAHAVCYIPSQKLIEFGYPGTQNSYDYINYTHSSALDGIPYYETLDFNNLVVDNNTSLVFKKDKPNNGISNGVFAKLFAGKKVKKIKNNVDGWDKNKIVGIVVGYKAETDSIIWQPTDEYAAINPAKPLHKSAQITFDGYDKDKGFHSCFASSLEICDDVLTVEQAAAVFAQKNAGEGIKAKSGTGWSDITTESLGYVVGFNLGTSEVLFVPTYELCELGHSGMNFSSMIATLNGYDLNPKLEAIDVRDVQLENDRVIHLEYGKKVASSLSEPAKPPEPSRAVKPDNMPHEWWGSLRFKMWMRKFLKETPVEIKHFKQEADRTNK